MPLYRYQGFDAKKKKRKGLIEAHNLDEAKFKLREQGVMMTHLEEKKGGRAKENLRGEQLVTFTIQLSQLVSAGIPLYQSLTTLEEQYRGEVFDRVLLSLCDKIKSGVPLSQAMKEFPKTFDNLYCAMIRAGESSGSLAEVLEKLSQLLIRQDKMKKDLLTAMIYPLILAAFCLVMIVFLLGFVVPSIEGIYLDRKLNGFTETVIGISHFVRSWWWIYLPLGGVLVTWLVVDLQSKAGKLRMETFLLKIPLIRRLMVEAATARFCRTMATLLKGGVPILESLLISRGVMRTQILAEEIEKAESKIVEGSSLSKELAKSVWIPQIVSKMLAVGEESGTTLTMLNKIAEMYEKNLEKTLARMMAMAQPIILIVMGAIIGSVILSILLPLTDMSSFAF